MKDIRTIYDQGAEEYGRSQLDWKTIGGSPELMDDGDFDFDSSPEDDDEHSEMNMSKQARLKRERQKKGEL